MKTMLSIFYYTAVSLRKQVLFLDAVKANFHGDFTEVFTGIGEPWVPKIQNGPSP